MCMHTFRFSKITAFYLRRNWDHHGKEGAARTRMKEDNAEDAEWSLEVK